MKPTLASQRMVGMTTSILPREGKTNEYRSGTFKLSCIEMETETDTGRDMDTTNFQKNWIRYGKETPIYIYII